MKILKNDSFPKNYVHSTLFVPIFRSFARHFFFVAKEARVLEKTCLKSSIALVLFLNVLTNIQTRMLAITLANT